MQCTEVQFASFFSGGFITAIVVNPPERIFAKCTSVHCTEVHFAIFLSDWFITAIAINPLERKMAKRTSVHCFKNECIFKKAIQHMQIFAIKASTRILKLEIINWFYQIFINKLFIKNIRNSHIFKMQNNWSINLEVAFEILWISRDISLIF